MRKYKIKILFFIAIFYLTIFNNKIKATTVKLIFNVYNLTDFKINSKNAIINVNKFYNELFENNFEKNYNYIFNFIIVESGKLNSPEINYNFYKILKKLYKFNNNDIKEFKRFILNYNVNVGGTSIFVINNKIVKNLIIYYVDKVKIENFIVCEVFNSLNNFYINNYYANFIGFFNPFLFNESISNFLSEIIFEYYKKYGNFDFNKKFINEMESYENIIFNILKNKYIKKIKTVLNFDDGQELKDYFLKEYIYKNDYTFNSDLLLFYDFWIYLIKKYGFSNFKKYIFGITFKKNNPVGLFLQIYNKEPVLLFDEWLIYFKKTYENYFIKMQLNNILKVL